MFNGKAINQTWIRRGTAAVVLSVFLAVLFFSVKKYETAGRTDAGVLSEEELASLGYCYERTLHEKSEGEEPKMSLYAGSALLLDADNNRVLYERNGYDVMAMASTTKIMTCILALEYGNPDDMVTVSARAASMPKVKCYLKAGEQYRLGDLLYSMMLQSHNDTAVAIAEHIGGSVEGFAELMNRKAVDLGCRDTTFITPNGLDASLSDGRFHSTTAYDLARIASYAVQNERFVEIVGTRSHTFTSADGRRSFTVSNADSFLDMMEGVIGIKTGFTNKAGYCFVGAVRRGDKKFISVVLACGWPPNKSYKWHDTKMMMDYGLSRYQYVTIPVETDTPRVTVAEGKESFTDTQICIQSSTQEFEEEFGLLLSENDEVTFRREMEPVLEAPVAAGDVAGYDWYYVNGELYRVYPICTAAAVERIDYSYCFFQILQKFFLNSICD